MQFPLKVPFQSSNAVTRRAFLRLRAGKHLPTATRPWWYSVVLTLSTREMGALGIAHEYAITWPCVRPWLQRAPHGHYGAPALCCAVGRGATSVQMAPSFARYYELVLGTFVL